MMGQRTVLQEALFYAFSIERHILSDHLLRSINRFVDLSDLRVHLRPDETPKAQPGVMSASGGS